MRLCKTGFELFGFNDFLDHSTLAMSANSCPRIQHKLRMDIHMGSQSLKG